MCSTHKPSDAAVAQWESTRGANEKMEIEFPYISCTGEAEAPNMVWKPRGRWFKARFLSKRKQARKETPAGENPGGPMLKVI